MADITIDTRDLTYKQFLIPELNTKLFDGALVPTIPLEPGEYGFRQMEPLSSPSFTFEVTADGLKYSAEHDSFLSGRGTNTLVVRGVDITLDGTLLSHDLRPQLLGVSFPGLSREFTHPLTLVPASGYGFNPVEGEAADFSFDVHASGQVVIGTRFAGFARVEADVGRPKLIIEGYRITLDGTALSHDLIVLATGDRFLSHEFTHDIRLIPSAHDGYGFGAVEGVTSLFFFGVDVSGKVVIDPRFAGFAHAVARPEGVTLIIKGYRITVDGRALSHNLSPVLPGWSAGELSNTLIHNITLIPASGYSFLPAAGIEGDFSFDVDVNGQVVVDRRFAGFARTSDRTLIIFAARAGITPQISNTPANLNGVAFPDTSHGWADGFIENLDGTRVGIIVATSNGGATWAVVHETTMTLRDIAFPDTRHGWAVGGDPPTILATADGGSTWKSQTSGIEDDPKSLFTAVAFPDSQNGWVVGGVSNGGVILATADGGAKWSRQAQDAVNFTDDFRGVAFPDTQHGWAVGSVSPDPGGGLVVATSDGGKTWERQTTPVTNVTNDGRGITDVLWGIAFADINHGLAVGDNGTILATTNGGRTWTSKPSGTNARLFRVAFPDVKHGWAVGQTSRGTGIILVTSDGGDTWTSKIPER